MKTKTGQFLMQQNKSKISYNIPVSQSKSERTEILTPRKEPKNTSRQQTKGKVKNKQDRQQEKNVRPYQQSNQREISLLRDQNKVLNEEIERLRKQCTSLKSAVDEKSHKNQRQFLSEQKQNIESTKNSLAIKRLSQLSQQQQQQLFVMDQKLRNLQVQNYRLIESNYVLLIRFRKNMRQFKDSLLKIGNMLENLQFAEASKEIYGILGRMKGDEGWVDGQIRGIKQLEKQEKSQSKQNEQDRKRQTIQKSQANKQEKAQKLSLTSATCHYTHIPPIHSQLAMQNSIQLSLGRIPSPTIYHHHPQPTILHQRQQPKSTIQFPSKKLFSFELNDPEFMDKSPSEKGLVESENGLGNGSVVKRTVYKCHGNSTELYKMLVLQAAAIESFFDD